MSKKLTQQEFLNRLLEKNTEYKKEDFKVISKYKSRKERVLVQGKFGKHFVRASCLLSNKKLSLGSAINKIDYYTNKLKFLGFDYNIIKVIDGQNIIIKTKYGNCCCRFGNLSKGKTPTIKSAIDKTSYFKKLLLEKNEHYRNGLFYIVGKYENSYTPLKVRTSYSLHQINPVYLLCGNRPFIINSINKTIFFKNKANKVHNYFYNYDKAIYKKDSNNITITCPIHGDFNQIVSNHYQGAGCPKCYKIKRKNNSGWSRTSWVDRGNNSKFFDSFKLYILKITGNKESFYKIGITYRTIKYRFKNLPYNYDVVEIFTNDDGNYIWDLEKELHKKNKKHRYTPKIEFGGMQECFTKVEYLNKQT